MPDFSSPGFLKALVALATVAILAAALDAGQTLLAPIVAAFVTGILFGPFTDQVERRGVPRAGAACIVLLLLVVLGGALVIALGPQVARAIANAPVIWDEMGDIIDMVRGAVSDVQDLQDQVTEALATDAGTGGEAAEAAETVPVPSLFDALSYGPSVIAGLLLYTATLYFFLVSRMETYAGIEQLFPDATVARFVGAERLVSRYFFAITVVNGAFGLLTFAVMSALQMPQPVIWGIVVFLANYILYLGPVCVAAALLVVGIVTFDGAMSFVPMACFVTMNMIEAQFVTPTFVGRHMSLSPLVVFLSLSAWLWLWGPLGGLIAIPAVVWGLAMMGWSFADPASASRVEGPDVAGF